MEAQAQPITLGRMFSESYALLSLKPLPVLALCAIGLGFDAFVTYVGGFITVGYGTPIFSVMSTLLQEVLYFGAAVLLWDLAIGARSATEGQGEEPLSDSSAFAVIFSGFREPRAWVIAALVTVTYVVFGSILLCIGAVATAGAIFVPGALLVVSKVVSTLVGPLVGVGYIATALAVARPNRSGMDSMIAGMKLMFARPLMVGLVLGVGGFLEEAAAMTFVLGVVLDAFLLCYCAVYLRALRMNGELSD